MTFWRLPDSLGGHHVTVVHRGNRPCSCSSADGDHAHVTVYVGGESFPLHLPMTVLVERDPDEPPLMAIAQVGTDFYQRRDASYGGLSWFEIGTVNAWHRWTDIVHAAKPSTPVVYQPEEPPY